MVHCAETLAVVANQTIQARTLWTHKIRTDVHSNLAYNSDHWSECPDDGSVLRHFGTGSKLSCACFWNRNVPSPKCPVSLLVNECHV